MTFKGAIDPEKKAAAIKSVNEDGLNYRQAAKLHGLTGTTIKGWMDPEYAAKRRDAINRQRRGKTQNRPSRAKVPPLRQKPSMPAMP